MFQANIASDVLTTLPRAVFGGEISVVETKEQAIAACKELARHSVIGFDTETRPSFKYGVTFSVALLQLSTPDHAFLFRLSKMPLYRCILQILENKHIKKVGVATRDDIKAIARLRRFRAAGFLELQSIVGKYGITELSLRKMAAITLGINVSKAQRLSNWDASSYTPAQCLYAATDAWVCLQIYDRLKSKQIQSKE